MLLREKPTHGYELIARAAEPWSAPTASTWATSTERSARIEDEGSSRSEWDVDDLPGPAKRTYEITDEGRRALERWAQWLREARDRIDQLIERTEEGR